jgi:hypothetical protein
MATICFEYPIFIYIGWIQSPESFREKETLEVFLFSFQFHVILSKGIRRRIVECNEKFAIGF